MSGASYAIHRRVHEDWDLLSAFLDGELAADERRAVEEHLGACAGCRAELDGLRRVASHLRRLERAAPPPVLADRVARRVAVDARRPGLLTRLEAVLRRMRLESPTLVTFGVVVALAAIAALFVSGVEDSDRVRREGAELVQGSAAGSGPSTPRERLRVTTAVVHGRTFTRVGSIWREAHLDPDAAAAARRLPMDDPKARALLDAAPRLRDLLAGSEGVVLEDGAGRIVRIEP